MSNSLLTDSIITKEALRVLKNEIVFTKSVNRQYDDRFAKAGAKIGDTINIRKPARYTATSGAVLNVQDSQDASVALVLDTQKHVGMGFSSKDLSLSIDEFSDRYIKPAVITLANAVDYDGTSGMYKQVFSSVGVPSATSLPSTLKGFTQAYATIASLGAPVDDLTCAIDPFVQASMVDGLKGLFQSSEQIKQQYEKGVMGYAAGMRFKMSQNVPKHTIGTIAGTPLVDLDTAYVPGTAAISTDGWSSSSLKKGDIVTFANVNAVNPQTRGSTGQLAQFTVAADVSDSSGDMTITLDRGMYASGALQNVDALPVDGAAVKTFGAVTTYSTVVAPQNLVFSRDAFALGCADLPIIPGAAMCARANDEESGLSIRLWSAGDIVNDRMLTRLDILYGWKCLYPEYACRVVGQPA